MSNTNQPKHTTAGSTRHSTIKAGRLYSLQYWYSASHFLPSIFCQHCVSGASSKVQNTMLISDNIHTCSPQRLFLRLKPVQVGARCFITHLEYTGTPIQGIYDTLEQTSNPFKGNQVVYKINIVTGQKMQWKSIQVASPWLKVIVFALECRHVYTINVTVISSACSLLCCCWKGHI